jgi:hypothetical protein
MSRTEPLRREPDDSSPDVENAILRTVAYSAVFQSPLTLDELHRRLLDVSLGREELRAIIESPALRQRLTLSDGLMVPRGEEAWLALRRERQGRTAALLERHRWALRRLASFPFVRLVALSGACAHENATDDDVDVFLVVKQDRAWVVCLVLMIACKILGLRRTLCLNYIVDEAGMSLPEQDLFTGSEIVGLKPLAGAEAYGRFLRANDWVAGRFPNFWSRYATRSGAPDIASPGWLERLLQVGVAPLVEAFSRRVLGAYLRRKGRGAPGVVLDRHRLKLHIDDHRPRLQAAYEDRLDAMGIENRRKP